MRDHEPVNGLQPHGQCQLDANSRDNLASIVIICPIREAEDEA